MRRPVTLQENGAYTFVLRVAQEISDLFYYPDTSRIPKKTRGKLEVSFRNLKRILVYYDDEPELGFWNPVPGVAFQKKTKEQ